jgi:1-deoxy-D-xylulose-5-phosphate reductoisomerase
MATHPDAAMVLAAQVGAAGLAPTLAAAETGKVVALANKESLVLAGDLFRTVCRRSGAVVLPVDSEHNAVFQALAGHDLADVERIVLTASGGPFRGRDLGFLGSVTREQALNHPNWSMGAKITIDSATLMNKGLEVIEACHLYGVGLERIGVVVHPQSIVHSLVHYRDGSFLAHLGAPDMRIPIAYCLSFPHRLPLSMQPLDLVRAGTLTFEEPDLSSFACLQLAMRALAGGPELPVVLNAANEAAVAAFLADRIRFLDIPALIGRALDEMDVSSGAADLAAIQALDAATRRTVGEWIARAERTAP